MDSYRHVNNTGYLRYLEEARIRMLGFQPATEGGWDPGTVVIASIEVAYRRPLTFRLEPVEIRSAVTRTGRSSFDIAQTVADGEVVYATATSTLVAVDARTGRSRPLEDSERAQLARFAADGSG
jgi:acyl-CoA thioester hydrolase